MATGVRLVPQPRTTETESLAAARRLVIVARHPDLRTDGDVVVAEVEGLGQLRNTVRATDLNSYDNC